MKLITRLSFLLCTLTSFSYGAASMILTLEGNILKLTGSGILYPTWIVSDPLITFDPVDLDISHGFAPHLFEPGILSVDHVLASLPVSAQSWALPGVNYASGNFNLPGNMVGLVESGFFALDGTLAPYYDFSECSGEITLTSTEASYLNNTSRTYQFGQAMDENSQLTINLVVPETSVSLLGSIGTLLLLRRRRTGA